MSPIRTRIAATLLLLPCAACGESGEKAAGVVQAATKSAAEVGQQLAEKAAELAQLAPEAARAKAQELVDVAARELQELRDSETAQRIAAELQAFFEKLAQLKQTIGPKLNLAALQSSLEGLIERFKTDPRVVSALKALQEKLQALAR